MAHHTLAVPLAGMTEPVRKAYLKEVSKKMLLTPPAVPDTFAYNIPGGLYRTLAVPSKSGDFTGLGAGLWNSEGTSGIGRLKWPNVSKGKKSWTNDWEW